ncbi:DUF5000 domain-containing lipoprotein [Parapedobacter sp. 10938]|uniref:DUF5000 domain-containing lipoprotein n=1 Tax=Parapedobacter flavus TaxID=3110225 RepID=UPI002DB7A111|nr:DUF5000 domain-containing lipoprotein [Parapedobacter sp. 10938]MEC3878963.1 DUF5000 domain-containing lipoprotein [Parapedobacter sp. 10938]
MINKLLSLFLLLLVFSACKEEQLKPISEDGAAPGSIQNYAVKNIPGGAEITFGTDAGSGVLYVEAEWQLHDGVKMSATASYFSRELLIEGFGDTTEYDIKLYAVGRNLKRSDPVTVKIKPLTPPIWDVFTSLTLLEDFGGMSIDFVNIHEDDITINVFAEDEIGDWEPVDIFYTGRKEGRVSVRGLPPEPTKFGIYVKDRWDNQSKMMVAELTPLYEEQLDKSKFQRYDLPTDAAQWNQSRITNLWSDDLAGFDAGSTGWFRTNNGSGIPHHFTFDMGTTAKLGRFVAWQRGVVSQKSLLYSGGTPKTFEVWGSNSPDPLGSFNGWEKLMDCEIVKPSARPVGDNTLEDEEVALAGHEFTFPIDAPPVRYIRIRITRTWGGVDYMWLSELTFYGQPE